MKNRVFKTVWSIGIISSMITFIIISIVNRNKYEVYNTTNYLAFIVLEIINSIFGFLFFKKGNSKILYFIYVFFLIITLLIPIYHIGITYTPTGPGSEFMGVALKEKYINMYGINIAKVIIW